MECGDFDGFLLGVNFCIGCGIDDLLVLFCLVIFFWLIFWVEGKFFGYIVGMLGGIDEVIIILGMFFGKVIILGNVWVYDIDIEVIVCFVLLFIDGDFIVFDKIIEVDCVRVELVLFIWMVGEFENLSLLGILGVLGVERKIYILLIFNCW